MRIKFKILLPVAAMMSVAVMTVSLIGYVNIGREIENVMYVTTQSTLDDIVQSRTTSEATAAVLRDTLHENYLRIARSIAQTVNSYPRIPETDEFMRIAEEVGVEEIHIADRNGILVAGNKPEFFGFDFDSGDQARPFLKLLDDPRGELAQEPQFRDTDQTLFQYIGISLGEGKGFLQIGMGLKELDRLMEQSDLQYVLDTISYQEGGYAYVLDAVSKTCTHHVNKELIGYDMTTLDFAGRIFEMGEGSFTYLWQNRDIYTTFTTIGSSIIVTAVPTASYKSSLTPILSALIITSILSVAILLAITAFLLNKTLDPLHKIKFSLSEISEGDADLTGRLEVKSRDELGEVASDFNTFIGKLQQLIFDIQAAVNQTGRIRDRILDSTGNTASSLDGINGTIGQVEGELNQMKEKIDDNATAMIQINSNAESFENVISTQAAMVEESTAAITQMIASLNSVDHITKAKQKSTGNLLAIAEEGKENIDNTSRMFTEAVDQISLIQEMASTISGIASQTNLLSMNAAIEAAHAGDSGKGFSVVADEIRKLAESSALSSSAISKQIAGITDGITQTSENMNVTLSTFDSILEEVESTVNAFKEIESSVSELNLGGQQIMASTEEINNITMEVKNGSAEIQNGIESSKQALIAIKDNSAEVYEGMGKIAGESEAVTGAVDTLKKIGGELDEITTDLSRQFNRFTV